MSRSRPIAAPVPALLLALAALWSGSLGGCGLLRTSPVASVSEHLSGWTPRRGESVGDDRVFAAAELPAKYQASRPISVGKVDLAGMSAAPVAVIQTVSATSGAGGETAKTANTAARPIPPGALAAGDTVAVSVTTPLDKDQPAARLTVSPEGTVDVPLVGSITVAGMTPQQAARRIKQASIERGSFRNPAVAVEQELEQDREDRRPEDRHQIAAQKPREGDRYEDDEGQEGPGFERLDLHGREGMRHGTPG